MTQSEASNQLQQTNMQTVATQRPEREANFSKPQQPTSANIQLTLQVATTIEQ